MTERLVEIPVLRTVRDKIREMKKGESYSEYLTRLTKLSEGQTLREQPTEEPDKRSSNV